MSGRSISTKSFSGESEQPTRLQQLLNAHRFRRQEVRLALFSFELSDWLGAIARTLRRRENHDEFASNEDRGTEI
jgi:hypothetical protein